MTLLWFIAGASLVVALVAWSQARRTAKRLAQLSEMYWELKYQHGELRVQLQRLDRRASPPATDTSPGTSGASRATSFVPAHLAQALNGPLASGALVCQIPTMSS